MIKSAVITCARWENAYLEEWIRYHLSLGFDQIYFICNDDDPTSARSIIDGLPTNMRDKIFFRAYKGQGLQLQMYLDVLPIVKAAADWICIIDLDEFIVLKEHKSIPELVSKFETLSASSIYFNWLNYGPNGYEQRPSGSVLQLYTKRSHQINPHTKHISHRDCFDMNKIANSPFPFWHGLPNPYWDTYKRLNILGHSYETAFDNFPESMFDRIADRSDAIIMSGYIAHFCFKSNCDAEIRFGRGVGGNFAGQVKWKEMRETDSLKNYIASLNAVEDFHLKTLSQNQDHA